MADHCGTFEAARLLGLSVGTVQSLVEQGELSAWKTPGGHRRIYLESIERYLARHGKPAPSTAAAGSESPLKVLIVEDDVVALAVIRASIDAWHLPIECVYMDSGVKALLEIGALRPQVLITDLMMPGVDGFDLAATLDRDPSFATLLMVAITSLSADEIEAKGGLPARVQVLSKPLDLSWLRGFFSALAAQRRVAAD